jgi:hypothetical protein
MSPALDGPLLSPAKFRAITVKVLEAGLRGTVYNCALSHAVSSVVGGAPTYRPFTYNEKVLSTVRRMVAACAVFPAIVCTVFLHPIVLTAALTAAPFVDQIQLPTEFVERFRA